LLQFVVWIFLLPALYISLVFSVGASGGSSILVGVALGWAIAYGGL